MLKLFDVVDKKLLLFINSKHTPFLDAIMIFLTERNVWIPFYLLLILFLIFKFKKNVWLPLLTIALLITVCDQFASTIIKPLAARLRPCHDPSLFQLLYLANGCGASYGFISSHSANTFGLACFTSFIFSNRPYTVILFLWASLISLSRIYLAAHYPGDVVGGAITGIFFGSIFYHYYLKLYYYIFLSKV